MSSVEALAAPDITPTESAPAPMDFDKVAGDVWDRMVTNNGADRSEDGRFVSPNNENETPPAEAAAPESVLEGADTGGATEPDSSTPSESSVPLPPSWQHRKEMWDKIPADARQHIAEMEGELNRKLADSGRQISSSKPLADAVNDFRHVWEGKIDPADGIRRLAQAQANLDNPQTRVQTAFNILQGYPGLVEQVAAIINGQAPIPNNQRQMTPEEIQRVVQDTIRAETAAERAVRESNEKVAALAEGKALYSEIPEQTMIQFIYAARSALGDTAPEKAVFDMAYEMATDSIPALKARKVAPVIATAPITKPVNTEAAKRANSVNVTSNSTGKVAEPSLEDQLSAVWEKHHR